jgi:excisionase family DNA binding protein
LLTANEAAKYLGVSLVTLGRIEQKGALSPYRTPGRHRRYTIEMLDEYLENSRDRSSVENPTGKESGHK